ncbi:hypothetical protein [Saccharospirillum impatiens]|uniref:hypothetical protein n=1 Tax=Saccharospirillum impatiens TaxID=169438 RepID=UPI000414AAAB|nr:hypothetical protein [Saccharospirillum impatiens]
MKRIYYLTDDIEHAEHIATELAHYPLHNTYVQVLSQDEVGLSVHQLRSASYLARQDIVHRGSQGLMLGLGLGSLLLMLSGSLGLAPTDVSGQLALVLLFGLLLGWAGCLIGLNQENHHLACFHDDIERGRTLMMIDVAPGKVSDVKAIIGLVSQRDPSGKIALPVYAGESRGLSIS